MEGKAADGARITVAALVVVNAVGSVIDPLTGLLYGQHFTGANGGAERARPPSAAVHARAVRRLAEARAASGPAPLNTTLAVVATDATLTRAQAQKLAGTAHDGIARAVRPVHLLSDGDTVFALATEEVPLSHENPLAFNNVLAAGADVVTEAIVKAVLAAEGTSTPGGSFPSYGELYDIN